MMRTRKGLRQQRPRLWRWRRRRLHVLRPSCRRGWCPRTGFLHLRRRPVVKKLDAGVSVVSGNLGSFAHYLINLNNMDEIQAKQFAAERPFINANVGNVKIRWVIDSGALLTCIAKPIFMQLTQNHYEKLPTPPELSVQAASGHYFCIFGVFLLPIEINGKAHTPSRGHGQFGTTSHYWHRPLKCPQCKN
jgi:hypothetical protein